MKNIFRLLILILVSNFLVSCDPSRHISLINKTDSDVKIKINLVPKAKDFQFYEKALNDSIVYKLKKNDTAILYCGIGTWTNDQTTKFANSVTTVEIDTKDAKTIYKSKKSIKDILDKNIKGVFVKSLIEIKIE